MTVASVSSEDDLLTDSKATTHSDGITFQDLRALLDAVTASQGNKNVFVLAVYELPPNCMIGEPETNPVAGDPPPPDNLGGVPPGHKSAIYVFPLAKKSHFERLGVAPLLTERFRKSTQMQAIIATSNHLYVRAAKEVEGK